MLSAVVVLLLVIALLWTYGKLISHFVLIFKQMASSKNIVVDKIFKNEAADQLDR